MLLQRVRAVVLVLSSALVEATVLLRDISNDQRQRNGVVVSFLDHQVTGSRLRGGVVPGQVAVDVLGGPAGQLDVVPHNGCDLWVCLQPKRHIWEEEKTRSQFSHT